MWTYYGIHQKFFMKLKDRGQDITGTISWTNLHLKIQIHQSMFH